MKSELSDLTVKKVSQGERMRERKKGVQYEKRAKGVSRQALISHLASNGTQNV